MAKSPTRATASDTVWLARGRHIGAAAEELLRQHLPKLKDGGAIHDHLELDAPEDGSGGRVFEARWLADGVVVRARLTVSPPDGRAEGRDWVLVAEAERPWDLGWPSPATLFWPEDPAAGWDHDVVPALRFRDINPLPTDERELKRLLKDCARHSWSIHVVVHEAMTTDERGRRPLADLLPPGLRHRVVEHRAAPEQFQIVNWALDDLGVQVPRGGAVVLPGAPARPGYEARDFSVRSVFLDGSRPVELIDAVMRFAGLPRPLPDGAEDAVSLLREQWHLLTVEEELAQARRLVAGYAEALEAMTRSRDLYREAAERAHEALTAYRESGDVPAPVPPPREETAGRFSLRALTRPLERTLAGAKLFRPADADGPAGDRPRAAGDPARPVDGGSDAEAGGRAEAVEAAEASQSAARAEEAAETELMKPARREAGSPRGGS
jgi:hypothetical protein